MLKGLLPEYELVGVFSRSKEKAESLASKMNKIAEDCRVCDSIEELLSLKPDYLIETATPAVMKDIAIKTLKNSTSIVTLSIGAFADNEFYEEVKHTALQYGSKVYIASGATGGFDVLRTATLMGGASAKFKNVKGVRALRGTSHYTKEMELENKIIFNGSAREAINTFPTGLNVAVAASLATVGPESLDVTMESTPNFTGDRQTVEINNDQVHAVVDVFSATSEIAAWSVVSTLQNIVSPIVF